MVQIVMGPENTQGWEGQTLPYTLARLIQIVRVHVFIHYDDALVAHNKRLQHACCTERWSWVVLSSLSSFGAFSTCFGTVAREANVQASTHPSHHHSTSLSGVLLYSPPAMRDSNIPGYINLVVNRCNPAQSP
jgi:hypothetical protein